MINGRADEVVGSAPRGLRARIGQVRDPVGVAASRVEALERGTQPPLQRLSVQGFAISDYGDLDRAGDWLNCKRQPNCPNRAYLTEIYATLVSAHAEIPRRARELARCVLPRRPDAVTRYGPLTFRVYELVATGIVGRDYRRAGCALPDASRQLREGSGGEPAWREIQRQRDEEGVEGALLPGSTPDGDLFLFVSAGHRLDQLELVDTLKWWG
jgi:hypothetical protein